MSDLRTRAATALMGSYQPPALTLARGSGSTVWDDEGRPYVDLVAGIAVCAVGHAHPRVTAAATHQMRQLGHVSNLYLTEPAVRLAERLLELTAASGRVFFASSGAEANEAAIKLCRRRGRGIDPAKTGIVAAHGSFHGRTLGALSITGQPAKRASFEPLPGDVTFVPYGDAAALRDAVGPSTAAIFLEPILGEGGVVVPPPGYLSAARAAADLHDALLVLDEVQTGVGRTGRWFGWQHEGVRPDVMTLAKGLGGGLPIGACIALGAAGEVLQPGDHGSTFGGNPVVCAAALAVLDIVEADGLLDRAQALGEHLEGRLRELSHPAVAEVRGRGLLRAIRFEAPVASSVEVLCRRAGYLVNVLAPDLLRVAPPLVVTAEQLTGFVDALGAALDSCAAGVPATAG